MNPLAGGDSILPFSSGEWQKRNPGYPVNPVYFCFSVYSSKSKYPLFSAISSPRLIHRVVAAGE
jgi:hypothetical protein